MRGPPKIWVSGFSEDLGVWVFTSLQWADTPTKAGRSQHQLIGGEVILKDADVVNCVTCGASGWLRRPLAPASVGSAGLPAAGRPSPEPSGERLGLLLR